MIESMHLSRPALFMFLVRIQACSLLCLHAGCDLLNRILLAGLNKNLKRMLGEHAEFQTLSLKNTRTASDGTRKVEIIFSNDLYIFLGVVYIFILV